ncbi:protein wech [Toxorhynchites rutilus septentrionalis]|uniref:protein wech n=1 Tax=Toxorhynchites rutilus septentrionalis TaxID=329112 RepID=UPI0024786820|nr:protein wech [Toxorhynchites rutilus septentrionalis]XP_055625651.1 protein wech [Toxorhynchites rutilus septentrionalis]
MALLSNGAPPMQMTPQSGSSGQSSNESNADYESNDHIFLSNLLSSLPRFDAPAKIGTMPNGGQQSTSSFVANPTLERGGAGISEDLTYSNALGAIGSGSAPNSEILGAIGAQLTPSASPQTNSSGSPHCTSSLGAVCGRCNSQAICRCLDCNDVLCQECTHKHSRTSFSRDHCVISIHAISSIGSVNGANYNPMGNEPFCDIHGEALRYLCETCRKIVCQECTFWDHKDHSCIPVANIMHGAKEKILSIIESGKLGTKYIKASIDLALKYSQAVERDALDASGKIRKSMRHFIQAAEDRERTLLERVDKFRQQKLNSLADQMAGLRSALAGLASTSDMLSKALESVGSMNNMDIARTLTTGESQIEQYAAMFKNLQPKEEFITFVTPNFDLVHDIRMQGDVIFMNQRSNSVSNGPNAYIQPPCGNILTRRPIIRNIVPFQQQRNNLASCWEHMPSSRNERSTSPITTAPIPGMPILGQSVPGCPTHVSARPSVGLSVTFGYDGHNDGQVSRPWGIAVDKDGHIIVADRRNNRVQVFYPNGAYKLKFGSKGTANGQFDLPAGICTDAQNRIIVVDKDNHRVQVFSPNGMFLLKFGTYGKDCGQFQYPWDVAVNIRGEMLVTDSRNHRIQLFSSEGQFISRFSFDGVHHNRYLKGLTTPRGICFTPQGDIIVTDFENHRLLLVDASMTKIIAHKGHEGSAVHEFSRPSGVCCDDDGRVIVADSKNQRVMVYSPLLDFLWAVDIRPSTNSPLAIPTDEKDRPSDVTLLPDGRLVVMVETSPDARDQCSPQKTFIQVY